MNFSYRPAWQTSLLPFASDVCHHAHVHSVVRQGVICGSVGNFAFVMDAEVTVQRR